MTYNKKPEPNVLEDFIAWIVLPWAFFFATIVTLLSFGTIDLQTLLLGESESTDDKHNGTR